MLLNAVYRRRGGDAVAGDKTLRGIQFGTRVWYRRKQWVSGDAGTKRWLLDDVGGAQDGRRRRREALPKGVLQRSRCFIAGSVEQVKIASQKDIVVDTYAVGAELGRMPLKGT